jgi:hypothetical protein
VAPRPWCGLALAYAGFTFESAVDELETPAHPQCVRRSAEVPPGMDLASERIELPLKKSVKI